MIVASLIVTVALYVWGVWRARRAHRRFGIAPLVAFALGIVALAVVLIGPVDELSGSSLSWHMVQHMAMIDVVAPLFVLAAPVRLALTALPARPASRLARTFATAPLCWVFNPAFAWLQLAAVLYGVHFSPLYESALENEGVHAVEHVIFIASGIVFWTPLLAVAPAPRAPAFPLRILSIFLALPMSAFLGFAFYVARHPIYPHYARLPGALADQMNAGAVMWIAGGAPLFVALLWLVAEWGARERRYGAVFDGTS
jgi:cytochrome c oxidase assembly factor CtaG